MFITVEGDPGLNKEIDLNLNSEILDDSQRKKNQKIANGFEGFLG
jgi:hypothetical protein